MRELYFEFQYFINGLSDKQEVTQCGRKNLTVDFNRVSIFWSWELQAECIKYFIWTKRLIYHVWEDLISTYSSRGLFHCGSILLRITISGLGEKVVRSLMLDSRGFYVTCSDLPFGLGACTSSLKVIPFAKYFPAQGRKEVKIVRKWKNAKKTSKSKSPHLCTNEWRIQNFPDGEVTPTTKVGTPTIIFPIFRENCMKLKKNYAP